MRRSLFVIGLLTILSGGMLTTSQSNVRNRSAGMYISPGLGYIPDYISEEKVDHPVEVIQIVDDKGTIVAVKVISK